MFFTQKQFKDADTPEKKEVVDIFNFDDDIYVEDLLDDDYDSNIQNVQNEKGQQETNRQQDENQFYPESPTTGLFGIQQRLIEDSDNDELQVDVHSMKQIEEEIKSHKENEKQRPKVSADLSPEKMSAQEESKTSTKSAIPKQTLEPYIPDSIPDMKNFLNTPAPKGKIMQFSILRQTNGMNYFYPKYNLVISQGGQYLMSAKKMSLQRTSYYLLTMDQNSLSRQNPSFLGKIRSNFMGTQYTIFDKGQNPSKSVNLDLIRQQLGIVFYQSNFITSPTPRRMSVVVPEIREDSPAIFRPLKNTDGIVREVKSKQPKGIYVLINKLPKWNEKLKSYVLKFSKRVDTPSVKNFQLIGRHDENEIILQFGKSGADRYNLDFQYPLTPLQAFSICITTFDYKIACE